MGFGFPTGSAGLAWLAACFFGVFMLARLGTPEEVASVIAFLCAEESRHVTGDVIKIDGGQYI